MQSILEFLQLIHDFLVSNNTVSLSAYVFTVILVRGVPQGAIAHSALVSVLRLGELI